MSLAQIEAELEHLSADELRRLALKSWNAFVQKEGHSSHDEWSDDDPHLVAELDTEAASATEANASKSAAVRDHSAFLNSYVPADEGLYDDAASR